MTFLKRMPIGSLGQMPIGSQTQMKVNVTFLKLELNRNYCSQIITLVSSGAQDLPRSCLLQLLRAQRYPSSAQPLAWPRALTRTIIARSFAQRRAARRAWRQPRSARAEQLR